ncbi:MAG: hypothetical protein A3I89_02850 [Candidatus Harrisonbacteria bacterium RIFCSPLOWO2_02_FULL_41_11]|uniref:Uncharacterized protein n=1 Tax=Candidatus Harrisonbacteria bacterium RIFCSPHIGHO2_02_FULL_42_16 TaxID=1798404 RepID=A0A1G1ZI78_9BACT|nr:MAG: hypothetical protein A3B92_03305 [Candidatus Harrisonbacteria bacterium RIFCSPHIGHO2_02_FULL_42_16]OGY67323.1 MAG: hypothetical protein A3I89_02850 [Candidatus Harrisonbacteria bacterium RIFCSPLOWO2_02_FULL_41_11]
MLQKIQNFFLKLREKDEPAKKRWLFALSSVSMALVIMLWGTYVNLTFQNLDAAPEDIAGPGFLKTFNSGFYAVSEKSAGKLSILFDYLKKIAKQKNSITIHSADINFILNDLENLSPKKLP